MSTTNRHDHPPRKGREIAVRDLRRKLVWLLEHSRTPDGQRRFANHRALADALAMNEADLSRAIGTESMSTSRLPPLLELFDLDAGTWKLPVTASDAYWEQLALEPFDAFRARVRLAGGDDFGTDGGSTWDRFLASSRITPEARHFTIVARDEAEWARPRHAAQHASHARMGPPRTSPTTAAAAAKTLVLHPGQMARVYLDAAAALPARRVHERGAHVFVFQDVIVGRRRCIASLVPFPDGRGLVMPDGRIDPGPGLVEVPVPRGAQQFLEIYPDWGTQRSLVAVITDRPLDEEIVAESRRHDMMQIERLDLLAARLSDRDAWPDGSWAVWELVYKVLPAA